MKALILSLCALLAAPCLTQIFPDGEAIGALETKLRKLEKDAGRTVEKPVVEKPVEPSPVVENQPDPADDLEGRREAIEASFKEYLESVDDEVKRILYESDEIKNYNKKLDDKLQEFFWVRLLGMTGGYREATKRLKDMDIYSGSLKDIGGDKKRLLRELQSGTSWVMFYQAEILDDIDFDAKSRATFERSVKRAIEKYETVGIGALESLAESLPYSDKWNIDQTRNRPIEFQAWLDQLSDACYTIYDAQQELIEAPYDVGKVKNFLYVLNVNVAIVPLPILMRQLTHFYIENFPDDVHVQNGFAHINLASNYQMTFEFEKALEMLEKSTEGAGRGPKYKKAVLELNRDQRSFESSYLEE